MLKLFLIFIILWHINIGISYSTEKTFFYEIYFGSIKLGESIIYIKKDSYEAIAKTVGTGNLIYPYFAKWITYITPDGLPQKSIISSKDRFKEREKHLIFDSINSKVIVERVRPKISIQTYNLPFPLYDELSAFITSWHIDYYKNTNYELPLYIDGERHQVKIRLKGKTSCILGNQTKTCFEIAVTLPEKSELLKRSKEITIILLTQERFPVEIKGSLPLFGSLKAKIKSYSTN